MSAITVKTKNGWKRAGDILSHLSNLYTLWPIAVAIVVAARKLAHMPSTWYPAQYWFSAFSWLLGTWVVVGTSFWIIKKAFFWFRRWINPHDLEIALHVGEKAVIEMTHRGPAATWEVRRRILNVKSVMSGDLNPAPAWALCYLKRDGMEQLEQLLKDGDTATVMMASATSGASRHNSFWITDGESSTGKVFEAKSFVIQLAIRSNPPMRKGGISKCFQIEWVPATRDMIRAKEISCD